MKTVYEWNFKEVDGEDIIDNHFCGKLNHSCFDPCELDMDDLELELVRDVYADDGELIDRQYAYVDSDLRISEFDGAARVTKKYIRELFLWAGK